MPDEFQTLKKERCIEIIKACNGSGIPFNAKGHHAEG